MASRHSPAIVRRAMSFCSAVPKSWRIEDATFWMRSRDREVRVHLRAFLENDRLLDAAEPAAAHSLARGDADQARLRRGLVEVARKAMLAVGPLPPRRELPLRELAAAVAKHLLVDDTHHQAALQTILFRELYSLYKIRRMTSKGKPVGAYPSRPVADLARRHAGAEGSRFHRDALVYVIGEGTSEIQRNLIARSLEL